MYKIILNIVECIFKITVLVTEKSLFNCVFYKIWFLFSNGTMAIVEDLKPFTLYQFKIRVLGDESNENTEFSQAIECYTSEDSEYL